MPTLSPLAAVLNAAERAGKLSLSTADIAAQLPHTSPEALRQALQRQLRQGRLVRPSRGSGRWLILPLQYAESGSPPLGAWLDDYLARGIVMPYYVGLLSAAECYGVAPYAVMVTQIMVSKPRRPVTVGRNKLVFLGRQDVDRMPTRWHETPDGRFRVSTPELTALDLVQREDQLGGIARVQAVLEPLAAICSVRNLQNVLDATESVPAAQRLGHLLASFGQDKLARVVSRWLAVRTTRVVDLEAGNPSAGCCLDTTFKVRVPANMQASNA